MNYRGSVTVIISLIAAMSDDRVIGRENAIPWHIPADLKRFKSITLGHPVIMGRKTFESIGGPLPGRKVIVLSRNRDYHVDGGDVFHNLREALDACAGADEVFICGGGEVYRDALPLASRIYLTVVHMDVDGDTLFPDIPVHFEETEREDMTVETISYSFILYERKNRLP
jgi:dihydrofolate reductase